MAWELVQHDDGKVEEIWREMTVLDIKELEKEYYAELEKEYYAELEKESGPIASRIADSYARLIERAEKAEREVERLKEANAKLVTELETVLLICGAGRPAWEILDVIKTSVSAALAELEEQK